MEHQTHIAGHLDADPENISWEDLTDVSGLVLDTGVPMEQRAGLILQKVKNPYCFRVGDMGVKLEFAENGPTLQECLTDLLKRKKSGL